MDLVEIGDEIRRARLDRGLSQAALADAADLCRTTVNQLETGVVRDLGIRKVQAVLELLGMELGIDRPRRPRPDFLGPASTVASETFKTTLTERQLLTALLTGQIPVDRRPHIRALLVMTPPELAKALIEQMSRRTRLAKLQRNLAKLAWGVGLPEIPGQWRKGG